MLKEIIFFCFFMVQIHHMSGGYSFYNLHTADQKQTHFHFSIKKRFSGYSEHQQALHDIWMKLGSTYQWSSVIKTKIMINNYQRIGIRLMHILLENMSIKLFVLSWIIQQLIETMNRINQYYKMCWKPSHKNKSTCF